MGLPRFTCPKAGSDQSSPNLYVANYGPAVGLSIDSIASAFSAYGTVRGVYPADESGCRVIVSYYDESSAQAALSALDRHPCPELGGRSLHIRYSVQRPPSQVDMVKDTVIRRGSRRVSFTFRKVRKGPCQCDYPYFCDSQG